MCHVVTGKEYITLMTFETPQMVGLPSSDKCLTGFYVFVTSDAYVCGGAYRCGDCGGFAVAVV